MTKTLAYNNRVGDVLNIRAIHALDIILNAPHILLGRLS